MNLPKFKDFAIKRETFTGAKLSMLDIVDKVIIVTGFSIAQSKYDGDCLTIAFIINSKAHIVFTSSKVLVDQLSNVPQFPFETIIRKQNKYFTFT